MEWSWQRPNKKTPPHREPRIQSADQLGMSVSIGPNSRWPAALPERKRDITTAQHSCPSTPAPGMLGRRAARDRIYPLSIAASRAQVHHEPASPRDQRRQPNTRDSTPVLIQRDRDAQDWPSRDEGGEIVRGLRAAAILDTVVAPAELRTFGASMPQRRMRWL